jgi:uncharacterized protein YebE (UPF0316 family)
MNLMQIFGSESLTWIILPLFIFLARMIDVTLGTMRIIFLSRGARKLAPVLGFFEVFIWIVAVSQLVNNMSNIAGFLAYASGFAAGNYLGMVIEGRLAIGTLVVRVVTQKEGSELVDRLHEEGFGVTVMEGRGITGPVREIFTIIKRKDLGAVTAIIHELNPKAFYSVEEIRSAREGIFPQEHSQSKGVLRYWLRGLRK